MSKKCTQIAIGGVFSALSLLLMFLTGLIPFATYALPAIAGAMLIAVLHENGRSTAFLVYVSVSVLSMFIVPDREAAVMFVLLFGYYPIARELIEKLKIKLVRWVVKLALFNIAIISSFLVMIFIFGMKEVLSDMSDWGKYSALAFLLVGNIIFIAYDIIIEKYTLIYINWFKPKYLRR